jgi:hypothetical protein
VKTGAIVAVWASVLLAGAWLSCAPAERSGDGKPAPSASAAPDPLAPLHAFEEARRAAADFAHLSPSDHVFGPDPTALRPIPGGARYAGILRGRAAVVLLDEALHELARAPAPPSPTGLAIAKDGEIFVSGEQSSSVSRYRVEGDTLLSTGSVEIDGARAIRDIAIGGESPEVLYAVEEHDGRLLSLQLPPSGVGARRDIPVGHGAFRVERVDDRVIVDCLLDHTLTIYRLDPAGLPLAAGAITIRHDGPIWGFDAITTAEGLLIAAGGIEDHPLDRTGGSFGFIDSFVFLYRIAPGAGAAERVAEINASSQGVLTPKSLVLRSSSAGELSATVTGAGGDRLLEIAWGSDLKAPPALTTRGMPPGVAMITAGAEGNGALVFADPLLDGWGRMKPGAPSAEPLLPVPEPSGSPPPPRSSASRVGEALFFTKLMAPWNSSEDRLSRFTCETCHFEGYVDGRIHHTGRGDVHATTKPLLGLFNNRPHFSRAMDPDLTTVSHNEFRVAGALSGHDPWFSAPVAELPWVAALGAPLAEELEPLALRKALMIFLMEFTHRPNPAVLGRSQWSPEERAGSEVFARRCERCHSARLLSDIPSSRVPPEGWEALVFSREGALVWGRSGYEKTGIEPYVHEQGARVPSLRRLFKKWPYFTNGSAKDLKDVLSMARFEAAEDSTVFYHAEAPSGAAVIGLSEGEKDALLAFLDLL